MSDIHFRCTACGKCCSTSPEMTLLEAIALGDVFVPALLHKVSRVPRDGNDAGMANLHVEPEFADVDRKTYLRTTFDSMKETAAHVGSEPGWDIYFTFMARPFGYPRSMTKNGKPACPALADDGKACTIHERRPYTCRTVPARYDVPVPLLSRAFRFEVERGRQKLGYECDTSAEAPPFLREDGTVTNPEYAKARADAREAAKKEQILAERLVRSSNVLGVRDVLRVMGRDMVVPGPFVGVLVEARAVDLVDDATVKRFCDAQIALLDREITAALGRSDKTERPFTQRFRELKTAYEGLRTQVP